ncbi:hypothetical protein SCHPADRAFT_894862 [Schizopora paradoxa]|uniref:Uncharacterized protein n=1 Tax=Schizopora paradoxa TaxID=27342 RepID=A0A0H2R5Q4_9AGAM|nr:hypothetical protein SCHPADRAFT_894862 [Schizopora paradoxa]
MMENVQRKIVFVVERKKTELLLFSSPDSIFSASTIDEMHLMQEGLGVKLPAHTAYGAQLGSSYRSLTRNTDNVLAVFLREHDNSKDRTALGVFLRTLLPVEGGAGPEGARIRTSGELPPGTTMRYLLDFVLGAGGEMKSRSQKPAEVQVGSLLGGG